MIPYWKSFTILFEKNYDHTDSHIVLKFQGNRPSRSGWNNVLFWGQKVRKCTLIAAIMCPFGRECQKFATWADGPVKFISTSGLPLIPNKNLANAKRPCGCSVLCLHPKSSLCSCPYGSHYGRIVVFVAIFYGWDVISGNLLKSAFFEGGGSLWG